MQKSSSLKNIIMNTQDSTRENFTSIRKKQYLIVTPIVLVSVLVLILVQADLIDISLLPGLWMVLATIAIL